MNYIRKHCRGELSLPVSFWINFVLLNIGIRVFEAWLGDYSPFEHPVTASRVSIIYLIVALALLYPWQIIGLWRACNRHAAERERGFVPRAAQAVLILGVLFTAAQTIKYWPVYRGSYRTAFQKDEFGDYTIRLIKDDSLVHVRGALSFGVSEDVERLLQMYPDVEGIVLDSFGRRIYEGRALSKLIYPKLYL